MYNRVKCIMVLLYIALAITCFQAAQCVVVASDTSTQLQERGPHQETQDLVRLEGRVSAGFRLTAELPEPAVTCGDHVVLRLILENVGDRDLWLMDAHPEADYKLVIIGPQGKSLERRGPDIGAYRNVQMKMSPGETQIADYKVDKIYDISALGSYHIVAYRCVPVPDSDWKEWTKVVSNAVVLTVRPDATDQTVTGPLVSMPPRAGTIPVRSTLEGQGYTVHWSPGMRTASISGYGITATVRVNSRALILNGRKHDMGKPARLVHDLLYVPAGVLDLFARTEPSASN